MSTLQLVGLGNALVDALVQIDDRPLLEAEHLDRGTMHLVDHDRWDSVFQLLPQDDVVIRPGGSCANAVEIFAQLGGRATFCGQVGDDPMGALYREKLVERLGEHHLHYAHGLTTGKCLSLVSNADAERTMLTDLGCATQLTTDLLPRAEIALARYFHLTGYLFTGGTIGDAAFEALAIAEVNDTMISFDVADPFVVGVCRDKVIEIGRRADFIFLNEEEAKRLAGSDDPMDAFELFDSSSKVIALKLGERGSLVLAHGSVHPIEAVSIEAVDTTGAGDAYAGAFLFGHCCGLSWRRCGHLASEVAAAVVGQIGSVVEDRALLANLLTRVQGD